jgi:hypothetical protein
MRNVAPGVLLKRRNKCFDNSEMHDKPLRDIFSRSVKGVIRSTPCCG